jgi:bifunctional enzyme CysN/CysC
MSDLLTFMMCGSVDDGKSTLIGRMLWESKQIFEDQLSALAQDSVRYGTQGGALDLALLVDGLQAEREQSITIDVAHRFFRTARRRFIVADAPGHEQYTRNMATAASNCRLAVLVVNATRGLSPQTYRHARIAGLFGIRHVVLAVNKMDLVTWDGAVFMRIVEEFSPLTQELGIKSFAAIPVSALHGDNVVSGTDAAHWYKGPSLMTYLDEVDVDSGEGAGYFRMPVQWVNRPNQDFRGYCGRVVNGMVKVGDRVRIVPSGNETRIRSIVAWKGERSAASVGDSITLCLEDDLDVSRGNVIASVAGPSESSDQFEAKVLCVSEQRLVAGRSYLLKLHTCEAVATIGSIKYKIDVKLGTRLAVRSLEINEIGLIDFSLDRPVPFEPYDRCRRMGAFILVDRLGNHTVAAGMIEFALRRAGNIHWQSMDIDKEARSRQKMQKPICLWLTGLPASGKSTIANLLEKRLFAMGLHTYTLDGDNVRHGLNRDLGFSEADRVENVRRVTEVARLIVDAGLVVIVSFISPYRAEREIARSRFEPEEFMEIFVDTPLEECERRDPKGLYAKARRGELVNFTGIDSSYEPPTDAELRLDTLTYSAEECVDQVLVEVESRCFGELISPSEVA